MAVATRPVTKPITAMTEAEHAALVARTKRRRAIEGLLIDKIAVYAFLVVLLIFALLPFAWMFSTSIKRPQEQFVRIPRWIPQQPTFEAYRVLIDPKAANNNNFPLYFWNSMVVSTLSTLIAIALAVTAAYAFSRFEFPGKQVMFFGVLGRNMLPLVAFLVPLFQLMVTLNLQNNYFGLILAYLTSALPLAIWLLKGFFDSIPNELEKAARIDGCTRFQAFREVILPLTLPGIVAAAVYCFITAWNEYTFAVTLTSDPGLRTLQVGQTFFLSENNSNWAALMAVSLAVSVPVVVLFLLVQRFFVQALTAGAVKG